MSATTVPARPVPVRPRVAQVPSVLAAIAGRLAWRLWWPVLPWLLAAALAWIWLSSRSPFDDGLARWSTLPSGVLLLAGVAAVPVLWVWGARYALGLGHDRGVVFAVTTVVSLALQAVLHLLSLTAGLLEFRVLGTSGLHVFPLETSNTFGTHDTLWNASWVFALYYALPVLVLVVAVSTALTRWGAWGLLGLLAIPVVLVAALGLALLGDHWVFTVLVYAAVLGGSLTAAWLVFRRTAV